MGVRVSRVLIVAAMWAPWLAACETVKPPAWFGTAPEPAPVQVEAPPLVPAPEATGSIATPLPPPAIPVPPADAAVVPEAERDPYSELNLGKRYFHAGQYGLAEVHFRRAVEKGPPEARVAAEAWLGLAASYDKLRRFELADRAYAQAIKIVGPAPEILNNLGYSYIMRGDYARARIKLNEAYAKDPSNPHILANLELLEKSIRAR
jgi:tetratricopeptide (TPR) repeat protein